MHNKISDMCAEHQISLTDDAVNKLLRYLEMVLAENKRQNLTRILERQEILEKHFFDSLALLLWQPDVQGMLLDIGSGAGFPGIPLKIARPCLKVDLLESSQKKASFLEHVVADLSLKDIQVRQGRAEELARNPDMRESYNIVVSRAVARLNILAELCLPFVCVEGFFIAYKGPAAIEEVEEAAFALSELNATLIEHIFYKLPSGDQRSLLVFKKEASTSPRYPRASGRPSKRPLK